MGTQHDTEQRWPNEKPPLRGCHPPTPGVNVKREGPGRARQVGGVSSVGNKPPSLPQTTPITNSGSHKTHMALHTGCTTWRPTGRYGTPPPPPSSPGQPCGTQPIPPFLPSRPRFSTSIYPHLSSLTTPQGPATEAMLQEQPTRLNGCPTNTTEWLSGSTKAGNMPEEGSQGLEV